jgi:AcrR family transcriptional regulator
MERHSAYKWNGVPFARIILDMALEKHPRADARRNVSALLEAALDIFTTQGVDAPVRDIAAKAGVGVGTLYRHFPQRSDLIVAVFRNEVEACVAAAEELGEQYSPADALVLWVERFIRFVAAKRGLSAALHSGDPAFEPLPAYLMEQLSPALGRLLDRATEARVARAGIDPAVLLLGIARLATPDGRGDITPESRAMISLFIEGVRTRG